jgi:hypothetical protein
MRDFRWPGKLSGVQSGCSIATVAVEATLSLSRCWSLAEQRVE